jgi:hypothetical protein
VTYPTKKLKSGRQRQKSKWVGEGEKHVYEEKVIYIRMHVKTTLYPYILSKIVAA